MENQSLGSIFHFCPICALDFVWICYWLKPFWRYGRCGSETKDFAMAPQMSKAVAAAAIVSGAAFVALPGPRSAPTAPRTATRGATGHASASSVLSTVGVAALGVTAAQMRKTGAVAGHGVELCAFENELGVQAPLGFWDPAGLSSDGDAKEFYRRRVVEIKHGRVSMLACTGSSA